ncbi:transmembrane protein 42 [Eudromia elegans]
MRAAGVAAAAGLLAAGAAAAAKAALAPRGGVRSTAGGCGEGAAQPAGGLVSALSSHPDKPPINRGRSWVQLELSAPLRGGCLGLALACNVLMWTLFAKALRLSSSSAAASVTTAASNFISSAVLGKLLFGETWTPLWWTGLAVTLGGLALLHTAAPPGRRR